ncbi:MAG: V-type ATP synthase subunit E [Lachnospiraceae bacterium]|nr:V-type ATP synthase subunit E [Lachnospiraceae bacterium]
MTGLDKIIGQIRQESEEASAQILSEARKAASDKVSAAEAAAREECSKIERNGALRAKDQIARSQSQAALYKRQAVLSAKQELIEEAFAKAEAHLRGLSDGDYFRLILKMAEKYAIPGEDGEIRLSERDKKRMSFEFPAMLKGLKGLKGGTLTVSEKTEKIEGGFVLSYGGIEQNCSFKALLAEAHDPLQDKLQKLLFDSEG